MITQAHSPDSLSITRDSGRAAQVKPARWLLVLTLTQVAVLSLDFSKLGLVSETGTDVGRWIVIAPGQVFFGVALLVVSPHLLRILRDRPGSLMILWFVWNMMTVWWSVDPRQTVLQTIGSVNLFVFAVWYVHFFGVTSWARVTAAAIGAIVAWGAFWQWFGPGPGFGVRFEGLSEGFNQQGLLCAYAVVATAIAIQGSRRFRVSMGVALVALLACVIATGGRIAIVATLGVLVVLFARRLFNVHNRPRAVAALSGLSVIGVMFFTSLDLFEREEEAGTVLNGRDVIWNYAVELIADSPIVGHGMMAGDSIWKAAVVAGVINFPAGSAHNMVIDVAVGGGIIGLLLLLAALFVIGRRLWLRRSETGLALMLLILLAGLTESLVHRPGLAHWVLGALVALATRASPFSTVSRTRQYKELISPRPEFGGRW